jgi:hypothetical protein
MKSIITKQTAFGVTTEELEVTFGPSGTPTRHTVTVPEGTPCRFHPGGAGVWYVSSTGFLPGDAASRVLRSDADIYGIPIPQGRIRQIGTHRIPDQ